MAIKESFTNTVNLVLDTSFFFRNMNTLITNAFVDFKDGQGYHSLSSNPTQKTYTDSTGRKELVYKICTNDGNTFFCNSSVYVTVSNNIANRYIDTDTLMANIEVPFLPIDGIGGGDFMQIRYAKNNPTRAQAAQHVLKPLIYVEGYDANNNYDIYSLIRNNPSNPKKGEWIDLFNITNYDFMFNLDDIANYDLVFVNYKTFRSFENNSKMLERVLDWVNTDKSLVGSTEKNVMLGVSAGGVLARYTLARMTKFMGVNSTDTRLLLTMDSPHQGANVPLSLQHFLYDLGEQTVLGQKIKDNNEDLKKFIKLNAQPATAQLLKARVIDGEGNVEFNTFLIGPNSPYQQMVRFDAPNNPNNIVPPYKFLAVSQGSQCGIPVTQASTNFASQDGEFAFLRFWFPIPGTLIPIIGTSNWWLKTNLSALPNNGRAQIEYFKFERRIKIWGFGFGWKTLREHTRKNPQGYVGWDVAAGGTQSINDRTGGGLSSGLSKQDVGSVGKIFARLYAGANLSINEDLFSFVSTTSALDAPFGIDPNTSFNFIANGNANTATLKYQAEPKDATTSLFNRNHTDYTARNARWLYNEMENINQPITCLDECPNNIEITGDFRLCSNTQQYSINGLPPNSSVTWSYTPNNGGLNITTNGNIATINKVINGQYILSANVVKPCNSYTTTLHIDGAALRPIEGIYTYPYHPNNSGVPFQNNTTIGFMGPGSKVRLSMTAYANNLTYLSFFSSTGFPVNWVAQGAEVVITYSQFQVIQG